MSTSYLRIYSLWYWNRKEYEKVKDKLSEEEFLEEIENLKSNSDEADYVDDFGNKTGKHYVCRRINGHFSNSATAWSELKIVFEIERKNSLDDIKYGFGTYKSTLNFDEYNNGVWDMQINGNHGYKTKIIKREKGEITMVCNQHARAPYIFKTLNGEEKKYYLVDLLKEEGIYEFEIETRYTKYYFTINSKYLNSFMICSLLS